MLIFIVAFAYTSPTLNTSVGYLYLSMFAVLLGIPSLFYHRNASSSAASW